MEQDLRARLADAKRALAEEHETCREAVRTSGKRVEEAQQLVARLASELEGPSQQHQRRNRRARKFTRRQAALERMTTLSGEEQMTLCTVRPDACLTVVVVLESTFREAYAAGIVGRIKGLQLQLGIERVSFAHSAQTLHHKNLRQPHPKLGGHHGPRSPELAIEPIHKDKRLSLRLPPEDERLRVVLTAWSAAWAGRALRQIVGSVWVSIAQAWVVVDAGVVDWLRVKQASLVSDAVVRPTEGEVPQTLAREPFQTYCALLANAMPRCTWTSRTVLVDLRLTSAWFSDAAQEKLNVIEATARALQKKTIRGNMCLSDWVLAKYTFPALWEQYNVLVTIDITSTLQHGSGPGCAGPRPRFRLLGTVAESLRDAAAFLFNAEASKLSIKGWAKHNCPSGVAKLGWDLHSRSHVPVESSMWDPKVLLSPRLHGLLGKIGILICLKSEEGYEAHLACCHAEGEDRVRFLQQLPHWMTADDSDIDKGLIEDALEWPAELGACVSSVAVPTRAPAGWVKANDFQPVPAEALRLLDSLSDCPAILSITYLYQAGSHPSAKLHWWPHILVAGKQDLVAQIKGMVAAQFGVALQLEQQINEMKKRNDELQRRNELHKARDEMQKALQPSFEVSFGFTEEVLAGVYEHLQHSVSMSAEVPVHSLRFTHQTVNSDFAFGEDHENSQESIFRLFHMLFTGQLQITELGEPLHVFLHRGPDHRWGLYSRNNRRLLALCLLQSLRRDEEVWVPCIIHRDDSTEPSPQRGLTLQQWFEKGYDGGAGLRIDARSTRANHRGYPIFDPAKTTLRVLGSVLQHSRSASGTERMHLQHLLDRLHPRADDEDTLTISSGRSTAQVRAHSHSPDRRGRWHSKGRGKGKHSAR
mmetsp:Transcript_22082/g.40576  ORF Transcript_22082/g.40576 Transcript_22082/m.40576 type:complete len:872 (+) Transcript_22082:51-2666(+)